VQVYRLQGNGELAREDAYQFGELVTAVTVHDRHLYVAGASGAVWVHRLRLGTSPELKGALQGGELPVALRVDGNTLRVALATRPWHKAKCLVGLDCAQADAVEVYDVTDRSAAQLLDAYPVGGRAQPLARVERDLILVPASRGFEVYRAE
jgi:hypothetical protein